MTIDATIFGGAVTLFIAIVSLAAWVGALSQKVSQNKDNIKDDRSENRVDHQLIFTKLEEINRFLRNGNHKA